ncbi:hypothetical protein KY289_011481 [Solanum tuberosum]|nr:hypothetical protein KY289_011481 [Solanum tuberosum]
MALDEGAFLYLKKPFNEEIMEYLWQFVLREKNQREKLRKGSEKKRDHMNGDDIGKIDIVGENVEQSGEKKNVANVEEQKNNTDEVETDVESNEKYKLRRKRGRKNTKETREGETQSSATNKVLRRKDCREWTNDLHAKFVKTVQQLGEGRCYLKEILEVMKHDVPDLTRMQVASYLQKCRRKNLRSPEERKYIYYPSGQGSSKDSKKRSSFQEYGTMPRLQTNVPILQHEPDQTQRGTYFPISTLNTNKSFSRGDSSTQQQLYRPQLQVQPRYLNIENRFNNSFFPAQSYVGDRLQQHEPLVEMLNSQGLQDSIIKNTSYSPVLEFNSGDHHNQSDYSLDLNVTHGETYSGCRIIMGTEIGNATNSEYNLNVNVDNVSNSYVGNTTINELGVANANFQQYILEPNMSNPSSIIGASYANDIEGGDSNKKKNCDAYFEFNDMGYLFQNHGPSSSNLPNEQGTEFDQVYSDDQVVATSSVQFSGTSNYLDKSSI